MFSPFFYELTMPFFTLNKLEKITESLHAKKVIRQKVRDKLLIIAVTAQ